MRYGYAAIRHCHPAVETPGACWYSWPLVAFRLPLTPTGTRATLDRMSVSTRGTHLDSQYFAASPQLARLTRCDSVSVSPSSSLVSSVPSELFPHASYSCPS